MTVDAVICNPPLISTNEDPGPEWPELVPISGDCFMMGSSADESVRHDDDEVPHEVCVSPFKIGRFEVTFTQYDRFALDAGKAKPADEGWGRGSRPVINVSQQDALEYARWLSKQRDRAYRLPTEAEWEFAARGNTAGPHWWSDPEPHDMANFSGTSGRDHFETTSPVGSFDANPFGLHDTAGNVWELTCSGYSRKWDGSETKCVEEGFSGEIVLRGGSYSSDEKYIRSAARGRNYPDSRRPYFGFRVATAADEP